MTDSLFNFEPLSAESSETDQIKEIPAKDHQVQQIRAELDAAGFVDQADRQQAVQDIVKRAVRSLRDLTAKEAHNTIKRLKSINTPNLRREGSAWDQREEDTWIDKL